MYIVYCDGYTEKSATVSTVAFCIENGSNTVLEESIIIQKCSIHEAEYQAIVAAIRKLHILKVKSAVILSDDKLVINQINRIWSIEKESLRQHFYNIRDMITGFDTIHFKWISSKKNKATCLNRNAFNREPNPFHGRIEMINKYQYRVVGTEEYLVDLILSTCTCPAYRHKVTVPCKHLIAVNKEYNEELNDVSFQGK